MQELFFKLSLLVKKNKLITFFLVTLPTLALTYIQLFHETLDDDSIYETVYSDKAVYFRDIPDLEQKIRNFNFNTSSKGNLLNLNFKSSGFDFEFDFEILDSYSVGNLKEAIISHFEFDKYLDSRNLDYFEWTIIVDNRNLIDESKTLKEVGVNNYDEVKMRIIGHIRETISADAEDPWIKDLEEMDKSNENQ